MRKVILKMECQMNNDTNPDQGVPAWLTRRLGKLVEASAPIAEYEDDPSVHVIPTGQRGVLLSIATKSRWGDSGVYCTVGFDLKDIGNETNVELSQIRPVNMLTVRG